MVIILAYFAKMKINA